MAIGAVAGLISDELAAGRADQLPSLLSDVLFATLVPYIGPAAAAREVGETSTINAYVHHAAMMKVLRSFPPTWDWPMASESRRELILAAMIRVVGSKGYKETSVADVIEEAGTSRTTFYKHFEDKHECFLAAYEMLVEQVFAEVVANCDGDQPWLERVRDRPDRRSSSSSPSIPQLARTAVVEVAAAGRRRAPAALERGRPLHRVPRGRPRARRRAASCRRTSR